MSEMDDRKLDFDILKEIGNIGAGNAATALSQMISGRVDMYVPCSKVLSFPELASIIGGEETLVAGVMRTVEEDVEGSMLFLVENYDAHFLVSKLMGFEVSEEETFTEVEESALIEIGNIISGAYINAISKLTNLTIKPSIPYLAVDMAGAILSVPAIEFGKMGDNVLMIESMFKYDDHDISGYFITIPTFESYKRIIHALGVG